MNIAITKKTIDSITQKRVKNFKWGESAENFFINQIKNDDIFDFFVNLNKDSAKNLAKGLSEAQTDTQDDIIKCLTLMIIQDTLFAFTSAFIKANNMDENLSLDERMNILIDLKSKNNVKNFERILADSLEYQIAQ